MSRAAKALGLLGIGLLSFVLAAPPARGHECVFYMGEYAELELESVTEDGVPLQDITDYNEFEPYAIAWDRDGRVTLDFVYQGHSSYNEAYE